MRISRPIFASLEVERKTASLMLAAMEVPESDESMADMLEALSVVGDAFESLKSLEYNCWTIRDQDIKVFMAKTEYRLRAYQEVVREWVARHRIQPQCKVGQEVKVTTEQGIVCGMICEILPADGIYRILFSAAPDGPSKGYVAFEAVHDLAPDANQFQLVG